ncbi:hypothetical protein GCM10009795_005220 [Nocardioides hankookensis]|uniref:RDD family protein n=1 Tax=Nocardioides hankookensis TaxID=443157 RepID=A0ABW1LLQ8_9ACTN
MSDAPQFRDGPYSTHVPQTVTPTAGGLSARFIARLIDFVLLAIVNAVVVGVVLVGAVLGESGGMVMGADASSIVASAVGAVVGALLSLAYFAVLESGGRQTAGKWLMKLRVVDAAAGAPSVEQAIRRNIWVAFGVAGVVPIIGGIVGGLAQLAAMVLIAIGINDGKSGGRGWHDRFAGNTLVVVAASKPESS